MNMAIPSYDDLTPSIPDVSPGDVFSLAGDSGPGLGLPAVAPGAKAGLGTRLGLQTLVITPNSTPRCTMPTARPPNG